MYVLLDTLVVGESAPRVRLRLVMLLSVISRSQKYEAREVKKVDGAPPWRIKRGRALEAKRQPRLRGPSRWAVDDVDYGVADSSHQVKLSLRA